MVNKTENDLGKCGPLSNVYKTVVVSACSRIIDPLVRKSIWIFSFSSPWGTLLQISDLFSFAEWILDWCHSLCPHIFTSDNFQLEIIEFIPKIRSVSRAIGWSVSIFYWTPTMLCWKEQNVSLHFLSLEFCISMFPLVIAFIEDYCSVHVNDVVFWYSGCSKLLTFVDQIHFIHKNSCFNAFQIENGASTYLKCFKGRD